MGMPFQFVGFPPELGGTRGGTRVSIPGILSHGRAEAITLASAPAGAALIGAEMLSAGEAGNQSLAVIASVLSLWGYA